MSKVSVILVTWNSSDYLDKCLSKLKDQTINDLEIIIVDNGSTDNSLDIISKYFPQARIIKNETNAGFAKANNQGISVASGEYVLLLNTDCFLEENYIKLLVNYLEKNPDIAGAQGKLLRDSESSIIDSLGIDIKITGVAKDISQGQKDPQLSKSFNVDTLCAAAAIYRRSILEEVKQGDDYFDTDFVSYYEDVDLGLRVMKFGYKLACIPTAVAYHVRGGLQKDTDSMHRLALRNKYFAIIKNWSILEIILKSPFILGWEVVKFVKFLLTSPKVLVGYLDVVRDFGLFIKKRRLAW